jgi:hypothetical protein
MIRKSVSFLRKSEHESNTFLIIIDRFHILLYFINIQVKQFNFAFEAVAKTQL